MCRPLRWWSSTGVLMQLVLEEVAGPCQKASTSLAASMPAPEKRRLGADMLDDDAPEGTASGQCAQVQPVAMPPYEDVRFNVGTLGHPAPILEGPGSPPEVFPQEASRILKLVKVFVDKVAGPYRRPPTSLAAKQKNASMPALEERRLWADMLDDDDVPEGFASGQCAEVQPVAVPSSEDVLRDVGTFGHPELCGRPCLFFAAGACANGPTCQFCHLPHTKRQEHLDRRQRQTLRELPHREWAALVLATFGARLLSVDDSPVMVTLLLDLYKSCGISPHGISPNRRVMSLTLRSMNLKALSSVIQHGGLEHGFHLDDVLQRILDQVRIRQTVH